MTDVLVHDRPMHRLLLLCVNDPWLVLPAAAMLHDTHYLYALLNAAPCLPVSCAVSRKSTKPGSAAARQQLPAAPTPCVGAGRGCAVGGVNTSKGGVARGPPAHVRAGMLGPSAPAPQGAVPSAARPWVRPLAAGWAAGCYSSALLCAALRCAADLGRRGPCTRLLCHAAQRSALGVDLSPAGHSGAAVDVVALSVCYK